MTTNTINVIETIDRKPMGKLQYFVFALCTLSLIVDGFDVQAMGYVAPAIIEDWGIAKSELGSVFGAGLMGMAIGALVLGPLADRIGRRPILIGSMLCLSICMFATAYASSVQELLILRFLTGLSMGVVIPNAVALAGEFSPARVRVTLMMITSSGFIIGGAVGGVIAAAIIPLYGWSAVFIVGALAPLLLAVVMLLVMPESLQFLAMQAKNLEKVKKLLVRIDPDLKFTEKSKFEIPDKKKSGVPFMLLFRDSLGTGTALLWIVNFMNLLAAYFLANWLPVIMNEAGHSASKAVIAGTVFWIGGIVGNLLLGWFVDRRGFGLTLTLTFFVSAIAIACIGQVSSSMLVACVTIAIAGFCILGGQTALNALAAMYYPTSVRSTGMSWAMGIGRIGSILGPVIGGELMRFNWTTSHLFIAAAVPAGFALLSVIVFWRSGKLPATASSTSRVRVNNKLVAD